MKHQKKIENVLRILILITFILILIFLIILYTNKTGRAPLTWIIIPFGISKIKKFIN